jgi:hypothetical protein
MGFYRGPNIVRDGLVFYLDAANTKSYVGEGTTWRDLSGNSFNASLNNSPTHTFNNQGYFTFNGTNQYTTQTGLPSVNTSFDSYTMELWFKFITLPTGVIPSDNNTGGPIYGERMGSNYQLFAYGAVNGESNLGVCYDDSRNNDTHRTNATISAEEWVQFVQIGTPAGGGSSRGKFTYYINGVLDTAATLSSDTNGYTFPTTFHIAHDARYSSNYSNLAMSIIRRYNRELSAGEVAQNFNSQRTRFEL